MTKGKYTDIIGCFILYPYELFPAVGTREAKTDIDKQRRRLAGREC